MGTPGPAPGRNKGPKGKRLIRKFLPASYPQRTNTSVSSGC